MNARTRDCNCLLMIVTLGVRSYLRVGRNGAMSFRSISIETAVMITRRKAVICLACMLKVQMHRVTLNVELSVTRYIRQCCSYCLSDEPGYLRRLL